MEHPFVHQDRSYSACSALQQEVEGCKVCTSRVVDKGVLLGRMSVLVGQIVGGWDFRSDLISWIVPPKVHL